MTKKHYIQFADMLKGIQTDVDTGYIDPSAIIDNIIHDMCGIFKRDNSNFDEGRFKEWINKG